MKDKFWVIICVVLCVCVGVSATIAYGLGYADLAEAQIDATMVYCTQNRDYCEDTCCVIAANCEPSLRGFTPVES